MSVNSINRWMLLPIYGRLLIAIEDMQIETTYIHRLWTFIENTLAYFYAGLYAADQIVSKNNYFTASTMLLLFTIGFLIIGPLEYIWITKNPKLFMWKGNTETPKKSQIFLLMYHAYFFMLLGYIRVWLFP